jgi:hypothetical protein
MAVICFIFFENVSTCNLFWLRRCRLDNVKKVVTIALVGKYTQLEDAYMSIRKALQHASVAAGRKLNIVVSGSVHFDVIRRCRFALFLSTPFFVSLFQPVHRGR